MGTRFVVAEGGEKWEQRESGAGRASGNCRGVKLAREEMKPLG